MSNIKNLKIKIFADGADPKHIYELNKKEYVIHGSSYLKLNEFGQIKNHRDYWDVGEELLSKIPILKQLYGIFAKRMRLEETK